ncbi:hypothetical protein DL98DRAFT_649759 [Cadophora sp. DSE1049]|nr:hypothetical protein DL98DRAFT_649759 [Cadophora sp. DSE1049]
MATPTPSTTGDTPASCSELIPPSAKRVKKAPSLCDEHHDMVTIIIKSPIPGKDEKKYIMHKSIACYYSPVLNKAFNGPFTEGQTQTMTIDDFKQPAAFGAIQSWMYMQKADGLKDEWGGRSNMLFYVWILADRLIMPALQNDLMGLLIGMPIPLNSLSWMYENTGPHSELRSLLVDRCAALPVWKNTADRELWIDAKVPTELLVDTLYAQAREDKPTKQNIKPEAYFVKIDRSIAD